MKDAKKNDGTHDPMNFAPEEEARITRESSDWLVRCDRGLTAAEQDEYLEWLRKDPRHGPALRRMDGMWRQLNRLAYWRPQHSARPNPDLLVTHPMVRRYWRIACFAGAAAAALVFGLFAVKDDRAVMSEKRVEQAEASPSLEVTAPAVQGVVRRGPEYVTLPDGTTVSYRAGTRLDIAFTEAERRIKMTSGQAHFTVTKDPSRPFIVETTRCAVRAVGTAFDVSQESKETLVTVTEGIVRLDGVAVTPGVVNDEVRKPDFAETEKPAAAAPSPLVVAGQRALIRNDAKPVVLTLAQREADEASNWRAVHLEFVDLPLEQVLVEFGRYSPHAMKVENTEVGRIRIGGTFRADQVDAFVQLLEKNLGFSVKTIDGAIVIGRR